MINNILTAVIRFYRKYLSTMKLQSCRFYPTCSEYALQSLEKFGTIKGLYRTIRRILKCHPFHPGGYDPAGDE